MMSTLKPGRKVLNAYRIETTQAYQMAEVGTGYSLSPAAANDPYYQQDAEPVKLSIPEDAEPCGLEENPDWLLWRGRAYSLQEMMGMGLIRVLTASEHYDASP